SGDTGRPRTPRVRLERARRRDRRRPHGARDGGARRPRGGDGPDGRDARRDRTACTRAGSREPGDEAGRCGSAALSRCELPARHMPAGLPSLHEARDGGARVRACARAGGHPRLRRQHLRRGCRWCDRVQRLREAPRSLAPRGAAALTVDRALRGGRSPRRGDALVREGVHVRAVGRPHARVGTRQGASARDAADVARHRTTAPGASLFRRHGLLLALGNGDRRATHRRRLNRSSVSILVRRWLLGLNALVLLAGLVLGATGARRGFFLAALVPLALAPFSYARWRLHRTLDAAVGAVGWPPRLLAAVGIACDVVLIVQLVTARTPDVLPALQGPVLVWFGPVWFSAHVLLLAGYGLVGIARIVHRLLRRSWTLVTPALRSDDRAPADAPDAMGRRAFLQHMGVAGVALPFAASASGVSISYDFRVEEREIAVPGWPRALDGLRVVHLSDIHVGAGMTRERLLRVAELTNACR